MHSYDPSTGPSLLGIECVNSIRRGLLGRKKGAEFLEVCILMTQVCILGDEVSSIRNSPELGRNTPESGRNTPESGRNTPESGRNTPESGRNTVGTNCARKVISWDRLCQESD